MQGSEDMQKKTKQDAFYHIREAQATKGPLQNEMQYKNQCSLTLQLNFHHCFKDYGPNCFFYYFHMYF